MMQTWSLLLGWVQTYWPYLSLATIPGFINAVNGYSDFADKCKRLIFFQMFRSPWFWIWALIEFSIPAIAFWFINQLYTRPEFNMVLWSRTLAFGIGFTTLLNAQTKLFGEIDIRKGREFLIRLVYGRIAANHHYRTLKFWNDLNEALEQQAIYQLDEGLSLLKAYFLQDTLTLSLQEREHYKTRVEVLEKSAEVAEKAEGITALLPEVRRLDLPVLLSDFGLSDTFIQDLFDLV